MRGAFGEIGDMRLHVMAAITIADELTEARRRIAALEKELERAARRRDRRATSVAALEARVAEGLARAAERIERVAENPRRRRSGRG